MSRPQDRRFAGEAAVAAAIGAAVFLARVAQDPLAALRARGAEMIATGRFDPAEFYVLDDASACAVAARIDHGRDLLMQLDGVFVLAPGWLPGRAVPPVAQRMAGAVTSPDCATVAPESGSAAARRP